MRQGVSVVRDSPAVFVITGDNHIATLDKQHQRLNGEINAPEVRLVGVDNEPLGIVPIAEALAKAEAAELDLVEIAPTAGPPGAGEITRLAWAPVTRKIGSGRTTRTGTT